MFKLIQFRNHILKILPIYGHIFSVLVVLLRRTSSVWVPTSAYNYLRRGKKGRSLEERARSLEFHLDPNSKNLVPASPKISAQLPEFIVKPQRQSVNKGDTAYFTATFKGSSDTEVTWFVNKKPVTCDGRHKVYEENNSYVLEIQDAQPSDKGTVVCRLDNSTGSTTAEARLELYARPQQTQDSGPRVIAPTVDLALEDKEFVDRQKDCMLVCKFHNAFGAKATWFKDSKELNKWQVTASFDGETATLAIPEASRHVCGLYQCVVRNSVGEAKTSCLVSLLDTSMNPVPPSFMKPNQTIEVGESLVLDVKVAEKTQPSLTWYQDNMEFRSSETGKLDYNPGQGHLITSNHPQTKGKEFSSVAKNVAREKSLSAKYSFVANEELREPPIFTKELSDMEVNDGDRVELSVEVKGTPPIDVVWVHNNREIPASDPVCRMVNEDNVRKLVIPEVFPEDCGEYVCEAYNEYGDTDTFCRLTVNPEKGSLPELNNRPPEFVTRPDKVHVTTGATAILKCRVSGEPPPSVTWSKGTGSIRHGDHYKLSSIGDEHYLEILNCVTEDSGQYTCNLSNVVGTDSASTRVVVGDTTHHLSAPSDFRNVLKRYQKPDEDSPKLEDRKHHSDPRPIKTDTLKLLNGNLKPVGSSQQNVDKKGGVQQIDFRDVLKNKPLNPTKTLTTPQSWNSGSSNSRLQNGESDKKFNNSVLDKSEPKTNGQFKTSRSFPSNLSKLGSQLASVEPSRQNFTTHSDSRFNDGTQLVDSTQRTSKFLHNTDEPSGKEIKSGQFNQTIKSDKLLIDKDSSKTVKNKEYDSVNKAGTLSQKRDFFEKCDSKIADLPPKSVPSGKPRTSVKSGNKVNRVLQKFENSSKETSPKLENRIPLKDRRESKTQLSLTIADRSTTWKPPERMEFSKSDRKFTKTQSLENQPTDFQIKHITRGKSVELPKTSSLSLNLKDIDSVFSSKGKENNSGATQDWSRKAENQSRVNQDWHKSIKTESKVTESGNQSRPKENWSRKFDDQSKDSKVMDNQSSVTEDWSRAAYRQSKDTMKSDSKPEFETELEDRSVNYGSEVILECGITGTPTPDVTWSVNNKQVKQSKFFKMSYHDKIARLVIAETFSEDEGEYTCTARNTAGTSASTCRLAVQKDNHKNPENSDPEDLEEPFSPTATPPKVYNISPAHFCILRDGTIEFKASYTSVPAGRVTWCKNKKDIKSGDRMCIETSEHFSTLTITNIQPEDKGRYEICVENKLGDDVADAWLTVEDVPEPPVGEPCVSEVTLTSVILSWYGPAYDGGCPITNYRIEICDAEEQEWASVTNSCKNTSFKIENLTPHTPYFFRIFAENKHGLSQPCQTPEVTVTKERRPSLCSRLNSIESDDVFTHETNDVCTPLSEYAIVSPLSPDEIPFEHREVTVQKGRNFDQFYECQEEIGKGKFGYVYKCTEKSTGQQWAAKILKCRESEKKKIQQEVEVMNQLKHPKILMLWDVFEAPRKMVLVMELIHGGELFERVLDDDFELTERDCIQFMRQILDAVNYMHNKNILHLDLKPENILCVKNESNKIKIIDFGLARFYQPGENVRVLFGTPEFVAPEVVNYDEIGFTTDMWSIGVICYVLLTGLSPFMGDNDAETLSNVTQGDFDFEDESFDNVSDDGKAFIEKLLVKNKRKRLTSKQALDHRWLAEDAARLKTRKINTKNLKRFMARRKWQKTGNAIRALGRMTSLQKFTRPNNTSSANNSMAGGSSVSSSSSTLTMGSQGTIVEEKPVSASFKVSDAEDVVTNNGANDVAVIGEVSNGNKDDEQSRDINSNFSSKNQANQNNKITGQNIRSNQIVKTSNHSTDSGVSSDNSRDLNDRKSQKNLDFESKNYKCPEFTKEMIDSKAFPGDIVRFDVAYHDKDSNITVTWYFEDEVIQEGPRHYIQETVEGSCSLIIKDICEEDDGDYACKIQNEFGEDSCSAELIVYGAI